MMRTIRKMIPRNQFARSVSVLATGTLLGQLIVVAAAPVLTRIYSPDDFGLLAVYGGLLAIFGVISSLRYQLAIPLPESDQEAASIMTLSLVSLLGMVCFSAVLVGFFADWLLAILNVPALEPYVWLLPLGLLLTGLYQIFKCWAIRAKSFQIIAKTKLTQAIGTVAIQLGGYTLGPLALLLGQVTGQAAGSISLGILTIRRKWFLFRQVRLTDIGWAATRYRRFPIYSTMGALLNKFGTELPLILFAVLFNQAAAGVYMLAHRVLASPTRLLGSAVADVFFSSSSEAHRKGELAPLVTKIHGKLSSFAMPPALILILIGPDLFSIIFGDKWEQAGKFAQWMVPFLYIQFVTSPLGTLHSVVEKQAQGAIFHAILLITRVIAMTVGAIQHDIILTIALLSFGSAVCWIGFLIWILSLSGVNPFRTVARSTIDAALRTFIIVLPLSVAIIMNWTGLYMFFSALVCVLLLGAHYFRLLRLAYVD